MSVAPAASGASVVPGGSIAADVNERGIPGDVSRELQELEQAVLQLQGLKRHLKVALHHCLACKCVLVLSFESDCLRPVRYTDGPLLAADD